MIVGVSLVSFLSVRLTVCLPKWHQNPQTQIFCYAATCHDRQLSRSTSKLELCIATRPHADTSNYRARFPRGTKIHKFKYFATRPDSYRVRPANFNFTPSRGHLRTQAAIALDAQEAPNILLRGNKPVQTAIAFDQQTLI